MAADELTGLIRYLGQDHWQDRFAEVLGDHIGPALEAGDITFEDLAEMIGPDVAMTLWAVPSRISWGRTGITTGISLTSI
ncbi:hypothetical protein AOE01nite_33580 [Acetobacter oeni]|uniref:Uncharacterized protein n=1 Tax=Acetobacter oeni TaxID=304077 RepID=A0A511XQD6_9PROT|nr:hypothetical protein [Acetobacter oeni]MBB3884759.1 hypothetical protein [Acetobacter oeni]GBR06820.1 hypothetical protein AA21952_2126 [Acetobacter oeni LMG 21952]GEN65134.1 hypothetical protein AOE01nite_33580 [Acetobacter oeni]